MKLNNKIYFTNKLTKLKLLETQVYQKHPKNNVTIIDITSKLKKALQIIYKYHINNKRILFVGTDLLLKQQIKNLSKSQHLYLPNSVWLNGIITNQNKCLKDLHKNQNDINNQFLNYLYQFSKKIDLVVLIDSNFKLNIMNESYLTNIPIIYLSDSTKNNEFKINYQIPGKFNFSKKKIRSGFFSSILVATLKKATKFKTKNYNLITKQKYYYKNKNAKKKQKKVFI